MRRLILFSIVFLISSSLVIANNDKKCNQNYDCQDLNSNRICNKTTNKCVCPNFTYENTDGWCKSAYNLTCQSNANCFGLNCTKQQTNESIIVTENRQFNGKCRCPVGTIFDNYEQKCFDFYGWVCDSSSSCQDVDPNRFCKQMKCICKSGTFENKTSKWCQTKKGHNETCENKNQCSGYSMYCKRTYPWETHKRCRCQNGFQWSRDLKECVPFENAFCLQDNDCQDADPNMICVTKSIIMVQNKTIARRKCQCLPGYRLNSSDYCTLGANRNKRCEIDSDCKKNMTCDYTESSNSMYQCKCQTGYFWSNDKQKCVLFNDGDCWSSSDCQDQDNNVHCGGLDKCKCKDGYKFNNFNKCKLIDSLYTPCKYDSDCPISGSLCNKDLKKNQCTCRQTHEFSPTDNTCKRMTCKNQCVSKDYVDDRRMKCSFGYCYCKSSLGVLNGYCMTPDNEDIPDYDPDETSTTNPFVEPNDDADYSGVWAFVLVSLVVGGCMSFCAMAVRMSRASQMQREAERQLGSGEMIATVSLEFNPSPDFVLDERPPLYSELAQRPPSYSVSVNPK